MNYATNIAVIDRATMLVTNVIWGMVYQEDEFNTAEYIAVVIESLPVELGDAYSAAEGKFYRDGLEVTVGGSSEEMQDMQNALNILGVTTDE